MGSRRGFICRMKVGNLQTTGDMAAAQGLHRLKQRNSLGPPARDGQSYAVVHCTGYIKNWPPTGEFGMDPHEHYSIVPIVVQFFFLLLLSYFIFLKSLLLSMAICNPCYLFVFLLQNKKEIYF